MIAIADFRAVLTRELPGFPHSKIQVAEPAREHKAVSACAAYAVEAFKVLAPPVDRLGLVCLSGATGATVQAFDRAWRASPDGLLTGEGFATRRCKHIHPLTLVKSLQNQVPAVLSMTFGIRGPCLNFLESDAALAHALPNIDHMLTQCEAVVMVLASAGFREEEQAKLQYLRGAGPGMEGAICFLLTRDRGLGYLEPFDGSSDVPEHPPSDVLAPPPLRGGFEILKCLIGGVRRRAISLADPNRQEAAIIWKEG